MLNETPMDIPPIALTANRGRIELRMVCISLGKDLCITLSGGDREHIGAVALSQPRASLETEGGTSATTSILTLCGHKEDLLARDIASQVAARTGAVTCVACGIHVDQIRPEELADIQEMAGELTRNLLQALV